jgi:small subunit ribosomal protein S2
MKELLEAGVHFGHQTRRWNPKMKDFIFGQRNGIYIIDLQKTIKVFKEAMNFVEEVAESGKDILMVGTKKQAQDIIRDYASQCEASYVNQRWLGGLLTNFGVIRGSVGRLIELEEMKEDGRWDLLSKKDQSKLEKVYRKLSKNLGGIKNMQDLPGVMVVIDSTKEDIAISEAQKLGIPIVAVVDTNGDPENIDFPIPGNDDAVRAIELFTSKISEAVMEGKKRRMEKELLEQQMAEEEAAEAAGPEAEAPPIETDEEFAVEEPVPDEAQEESPPETAPQEKAASVPEVRPEEESGAEPVAEPEGERVPEAEPEEEPETRAEAETEPEAKSEPAPESKPESSPGPEEETEEKPQPESEPASPEKAPTEPEKPEGAAKVGAGASAGKSGDKNADKKPKKEAKS